MSTNKEQTKKRTMKSVRSNDKLEILNRLPTSRYVYCLMLLTLTLVRLACGMEALPIPVDKLRPPPSPVFPTATPPAPRYPLYPYIIIPKPPRNPCARMEGDDCRTGCCYPGLVCSLKLGRCANIFRFREFERGIIQLPD